MLNNPPCLLHNSQTLFTCVGNNWTKIMSATCPHSSRNWTKNVPDLQVVRTPQVSMNMAVMLWLSILHENICSYFLILGKDRAGSYSIAPNFSVTDCHRWAVLFSLIQSSVPWMMKTGKDWFDYKFLHAGSPISLNEWKQ